MQLNMNRKPTLFSTRFHISDEHNNAIYFVKSKFSLRFHSDIFDVHKKRLACVRASIKASFPNKYELYIEDHCIGIVQSIGTRQRYEVLGLDWVVVREKEQWYVMDSGKEIVIEIMRNSEGYAIDVRSEKHALVAILLSLMIDRENR